MKVYCDCRCVLRLAAVHCAGVHADLADVEAVRTSVTGNRYGALFHSPAEHPAEEALEAKTVSTVRARAVLALVSVPVVGRGVNAFALVSGQECIVVPDTHRSADDFTDVGHQKINLA